MQNLDSVSHIVCMRARKGFQEILALCNTPSAYEGRVAET